MQIVFTNGNTLAHIYLQVKPDDFPELTEVFNVKLKNAYLLNINNRLVRFLQNLNSNALNYKKNLIKLE